MSTSVDTIPDTFHRFFSSARPNSNHLVIKSAPGGLSVGLVWSTDSTFYSGLSNKSINLDQLFSLLLPLVDLDLIDIHSLQVGSSSSDINPWLTTNRITDWSQSITSFSDTAYILKSVRFVISIDTAVAHLSASLGIPTWILLPFDSDFRWLLSRSDSPWYTKNVRLFRQLQPNDWTSVLQSMRSALNRLFFVNLIDLASGKIKP